MTDKINDGGPAFPQTRQQWQDSDHGGRYVTVDLTGGMTLRDYFAGQALASLAGSVSADGSDFLHSAGVKSAARWAYSFADAMLAARGGGA